jgi:hypothetical protein
MDEQYVFYKKHGEVSEFSTRIVSHSGYEMLKASVFETSRANGNFDVDDTDSGANLQDILPPELMLGLTLHVFTSFHCGKPVVGFGVTGSACYALKDKVNPKIRSDFGVTMKWKPESKMWCSELTDDLEFETIQAVSDYVSTLGVNYKKNLTKLKPEIISMIISMIPEFLAGVKDE